MTTDPGTLAAAPGIKGRIAWPAGAGVDFGCELPPCWIRIAIGLSGWFLGLLRFGKLPFRTLENVVVEQMNRSAPPAPRTQKVTERRTWVDARHRVSAALTRPSR